MVRPIQKTNNSIPVNNGRLLVFNCHESWVYQLRVLGMPMDIIVDLPGRYYHGWDERMRPVPPNSRLVYLDEALRNQEQYACIITHNVPDLLDVRDRQEAKILVIHLGKEARVVEERAKVDPDLYQSILHRYVEQSCTHVIAVTQAKGDSWGFPDNVIHAGVDACDYHPHSGHVASGLRVCNFMRRRPQFVYWDFFQQAIAGLPMRIVGHNPDIPDAAPSQDWYELRRILRDYRFYVHTADPVLEDGFNMAMLEAMAAGLPVLGNDHPSSPIVNYQNGFLSDDPVELHAFAQRLLDDPELAYDMGQKARQQVLEQFPLHAFRQRMLEAIMQAQALVTDSHHVPDVSLSHQARRPEGDPVPVGML